MVLEFAPSLKIAAGEKLACEPAYFGVYRRGPLDKEEKGLPLQSESDAMVAMTSAILGPPRFGLVPMVNGWLSQMAHGRVYGAVRRGRHEIARCHGPVRHRLV